MRAVVHWFRSVAILGGLCALPCGQAAPSSVIEGGSAHRPALVLVAVAGAGDTNLPTTMPRGANFVEASVPVTLSTLRHGARDLAAAPAAAGRTAVMPVGFGTGQLQHDELTAGGHAPDANTTLALVLAALGVAALAAARAPAVEAESVETLPGEPVHH